MANMDAYTLNYYIPFAIDYSTSLVFKCIDFVHLQIA